MRRPILYFTFSILHFTLLAQKDYTSLVNPFIGTGGHGHTYPGASMPFGMMQLSPDTRMADWDGSSGYHYSDSVIYGFSHTHLSGTGIPDYCDVLLMPFIGEPKFDNKEYRSSFSHKNEKASPGYYEVLLDKFKIKVQLTTTLRCGMHQYTFPATATKASILIDLKHRDKLLDYELVKVNDHEVKGFRRSRSWANDQVVYFYISFDQAIRNWQANSDTENQKPFSAAFDFDLKFSKILRCKVGISAVSTEGAKRNLDAEIRDWNFENLRNKARSAWNKELSKIDIKGGTRDQQVSFYTALYHTFLVPNIYQDVDGQFVTTDHNVHKAIDFTNYTVFSLWDTYRAYNPLMTIINQKRMNDWIKTFLTQYQYGGMLPVWELSGNETFCMIGYHSVPVIADAYKKGIRNFDAKLALKAMLSYAESNRFGLNTYRQRGYISNEIEQESVSKTLEYAYDDWCIAQFAKMIGNDSVYNKYIQRAQYYKNVFDPATHHMRGKLQAMWYQPFDAKEVNNFFTEGNSWQYSFAVPQDIGTLIDLHGGKESFASKLNELFTTTSQTTGRDQADVTGLIGQYAQGNEPSHHMAYLFNYVGMPWRTQEIVHSICTEFYKNDPNGLIGNEDCGQMSAWYILSSMGFYPVCPGTGEYVLGTPLFNEVKIKLENGKQFLIRAKRNTANAKYVTGTSLNGKPLTRSYLSHPDIMNGGVFEFTLSGTPGKNWGTGSADLPHSKINAEEIVPVPFFDISTNKFRDSMLVSIKSIDSAVKYEYAVFANSDSGFETGRRRTYTGPFFIDSSQSISAFAIKNGRGSFVVGQVFYKVPSDKSITVLTKVNPMYTGGGPDALIDGIMGNKRWQTGEWQSYYGQDFEAIIDLKQSKEVSYVGIHVLQDPGPWILYPKELIIYTSSDGKDFNEVGRVHNTSDQKIETIETKEMGEKISLQTRYIKVKALNAGKLPAWHESAGNPSHLFIDEVIVR